MSGDIGKDDHNVWDGSRDTHQDKSYEQLKEEVAALKNDYAGLLRIVEDLDAFSNLLAENIKDLKDKNRSLSDELNHLRAVMSGGVNKTTQRAYLLADAVKASSSGFITRPQARSILAEEGVKLHTKTTDDAMQAAAEIFGFVYGKNMSGKVILRVK
ncbi:hypothetical protein V7O61_08365 [Methanolobus sp. WCC1]|jgi:hypothetical protein|uniref:hypothetical protein n=1 Tax=unclassified Methanolobus TaxID=2629569 RepID=UPI0032453D0F